MGQQYEQLQELERDEIYWLICAGVSQAEIGRQLGRNSSTISRESDATGRRTGRINL
jgi:IS30 family transposase